MEVIHLRSKPSLSAEVLAEFPSLRLVALGCKGFDHIDLDYCRQNGIQVVHLPAANAVSVAELTLGLLFQGLRHLEKAQLSLRQGQWKRELFTGRELAGMKIGLVGLGEIGKRVARRLQAFEVWVYAHDPYLDESQFKALGVKSLCENDIFSRVDGLSLHCPLNEETRHLINQKNLSKMKDQAFLINTARGGLVDEDALLTALQENKLSFAALDVFEEEPLPQAHAFRSQPNCILSPHLGSRTHEAMERMESEIIDHIVRFLQSGELRYSVLEEKIG